MRGEEIELPKESIYGYWAWTQLPSENWLWSTRS